MPKEPKKRATRGSSQLDPQQCQHPGHCSNKRAFKKNGERHWICVEHRDHQNALQRDRYRRVVSKKRKQKMPKKKETTAPKTDAKDDPTTQKKTTKTTKKKTLQKVSSTQKKGEVKSVQVAKVVEKAPAQHPATAVSDRDTALEHTAEPRADGERPPSSIDGMQQDSHVCEPSLCVCQASSTIQVHQVVYVLVPVQLGSAQPSLVPNATVLAAGGLTAAQAPQVVLPVSQVAYSPVPSPSSVCEASVVTGSVGGNDGGVSSASDGKVDSSNVRSI